MYEKLFGGFEDLGDEDSEEEARMSLTMFQTIRKPRMVTRKMDLLLIRMTMIVTMRVKKRRVLRASLMMKRRKMKRWSLTTVLSFGGRVLLL